MQANSTYQQIQIYLAGRSLRDLDFFSKSDPYVKVSYRRDFNCKNYVVLGKTQTVLNNLNPNFDKPISLDYIFQSRQDIKFQIFDDDGKGDNDDFVGSVQTTVGALMGAKNQMTILQLSNNGKKMGKLIVKCQKVGTSSENYQMKFKAVKLANTDSFFDFWDKSDPYIKLLKIRPDNSLILAHKTTFINNCLDPNWPPIVIQAYRLHDEQSGNFKVQIWDYEEDGKDKFIGQAIINAKQLKNSNNTQYPRQITLTNQKIKKPGKLILQSFKTFMKPKFIDYLKGGLQLNMIIAVDFTGSNGTPNQPTSLHYMDPKNPNQYQKAIGAVAQILLNYDSDKRIPAFGFGANLHFPNMNGLSHCFPLSGNWNDVDSVGLPHLMQLYKQSLSNLQLSGPTYFGPIIEQVAKISRSCQEREAFVYQTLLILTDGQIHDMEKVIDLIINCCNLPLSIIIVGVGQASFDNMNRLDGDQGLFGSKGQKATRDIVQFVPFRDVQFNSDVLAQNLLAELPNQVVQYYQSKGINPRAPPPQVSMSEMLMSGAQNQQAGFGQIAGLINQAYNMPGQQQQQKPKIMEFEQDNNVNPYGSS